MRFERVPDLCQRFGLTFPALLVPTTAGSPTQTTASAPPTSTRCAGGSRDFEIETHRLHGTASGEKVESWSVRNGPLRADVRPMDLMAEPLRGFVYVAPPRFRTLPPFAGGYRAASGSPRRQGQRTVASTRNVLLGLRPTLVGHRERSESRGSNRRAFARR
jgi:hypothetical protein